MGGGDCKNETKGEDVLLIGMAASGLDLMLQLQNVANRITISRKKPMHLTEDAPLEQQQPVLPPKTVLKDSVKRFTSDGAEFIDGSWQSFTTIVYATGEQSAFLATLRFEDSELKDRSFYSLSLPLFLPLLHQLISIGYRYSFPFLSDDSGIHIEDNFVQPLYKHIINIEHPTMVFIGLADLLGTFMIFDLEV